MIKYFTWKWCSKPQKNQRLLSKTLIYQKDKNLIEHVQDLCAKRPLFKEVKQDLG